VRSLAGASVAVTGGARGIGRLAAIDLAAAGARVAIGDLDGDAAEGVAAEIGDAGTGHSLDVAERDSFAAFLNGAEEANGPLDALVSNAGIMPLGRFTDADPAVLERTVDVNLKGAVNALSLALPAMVERGRGRVVLVASLMGRITVPGAAIYGASKHAVIALTDAVRAELRGSGVDVVTVNPTMVRTELAAGVPEGRGLPVVEPEEVAAAIVRACAEGGVEVAVPGWLGPVTRLSAAVPPALMRPIRWALRDDRVLTRLDPAERRAYEAELGAEQPGDPPGPAG
jgi:NAD(P)-dependent dehydrogenase (short-subunit alcohol dehydrogenase family)